MGKRHSFARYKTKQNQDVVFPVCFVEGVDSGPKVCITAGVHGCEYPAIAASIRLYQQLDPLKIRGRVCIIPIVNHNAFKERSMFVCPEDGKNLNRVMPGNENGTFSEVLAHYIFEDFIQGSDAYIDLHGGDMVEDLIPFSLVHRGTNEEVFRKSKNLAEHFGLGHIVFTSGNGSWSDKGTTYAAAAEIGIPSMIGEVGRVGQLTETDVGLHFEGLINVLKHLGILEGTSFRKGQYDYFDQFIWVRSNQEGIFYSECEVGQYIEEGNKLGLVENCFGEHLEIIKSPCSGKIMFLTTSPAVKEKGLLLAIGI